MLEQLQNREDQGKYFWELRSCAYWEEFEQPTMIYPELALTPQYTFSNEGWFADCTLYIVPTKGPYLSALMNSRPVQFFFQQISPKVRGGYMRFKSIYMSQIPVPSNGDEKVIEKLANKILACKRIGPAADVSAIEREIDQLVYKLYNLTPEEIKIVGNTQ